MSLKLWSIFSMLVQYEVIVIVLCGLFVVFVCLLFLSVVVLL